MDGLFTNNATLVIVLITQNTIFVLDLITQNAIFVLIFITQNSVLYFQDLQKLQAEVDNVYRSLGYIKAVIDQEKPQIVLVPNTATVVLEHVNDVFLILNSFFISQDRYVF